MVRTVLLVGVTLIWGSDLDEDSFKAGSVIGWHPQPNPIVYSEVSSIELNRAYSQERMHRIQPK